MGARIQNRRGLPSIASQPPNIGLSSLGVFGRSNMGLSSDGREETEAESIDRAMRRIEQNELEEAMRRSLEQADGNESLVIYNRGVSYDSRRAEDAQEERLSFEEIEKQALEEAIKISLIDSELQMKS